MSKLRFRTDAAVHAVDNPDRDRLSTGWTVPTILLCGGATARLIRPGGRVQAALHGSHGFLMLRRILDFEGASSARRLFRARHVADRAGGEGTRWTGWLVGRCCETHGTPGRYHESIAVNDIALTLATMLEIGTPSGSVGLSRIIPGTRHPLHRRAASAVHALTRKAVPLKRVRRLTWPRLPRVLAALPVASFLACGSQ
jgi:hypothetical protein